MLCLNVIVFLKNIYELCELIFIIMKMHPILLHNKFFAIILNSKMQILAYLHILHHK